LVWRNASVSLSRLKSAHQLRVAAVGQKRGLHQQPEIRFTSIDQHLVQPGPCSSTLRGGSC
jgi:hypothetical protein